MTGGLAWFGGLPAALVVLCGLLAFALSLSILKLASSQILAWFGIGAFIGLGLLLANWQRDRFKVEFVEARVGYGPADLSRTRVAYATVSLVFENPNDFPIWVKSIRRTSSLNMRISDSEQSVQGKERRATSVFGISDQPIQFPEYPHFSAISEGFVDFEICYGRSKDDATKGLAIRGKLAPRYSETGLLRVDVHSETIREFSCDGNE